MKEITRISLAQLPYNIEVAAKKSLEHYLAAIESSLGADSDTMKEVESRIVELLSERGVTGEKVISAADVEHVRQQMGEPKEFAGESYSETGVQKQAKRLMRSEGEEILGGVCSGMAAYIGIDVVWVRLVFVVLAFVTGGFMVLIYFVLWIVMPPAKTAADRLQMKGEAVTLSALQAESEVLVDKRRNDTLALEALRITGGVLAIVAGIGVLAVTIAITRFYLVSLTQDLAVLSSGQHWLYFGLMVLAGVLLSILCWLGAYMLIVGKATKRLLISAAIIVAAGLVSFAAGAIPMALSMRSIQSNYAAEYTKSSVQKSVDASVFVGAKAMVLDSPMPITLNYNTITTTTGPNGTLWYNTKNTKTTPEIKFERKGDVVHVSLITSDTSCMPDIMRCRTLYTLTMTGPTLDSISAMSSNTLHYTTDKQDTLRTYTRAGGRIELQSIGTVANVTATLSNESHLDVMQASIITLSLVFEDALSSADVATVDRLSITIPTACAENHNLGSINVRRAQSMTVNDQPFVRGKDYSCGVIQLSQ